MKIRRFKKIGRNELCPCGSGKKHKNCECYLIIKSNTYVDTDTK